MCSDGTTTRRRGVGDAVTTATVLAVLTLYGCCAAKILTGGGGGGAGGAGDLFGGGGVGRGPSALVVNPVGLQPRFMSSSHTYKLVVGDTVLLPCEVKNLGSFVLVWRKGATLLSAGSTMVSLDSRLQLLGNGAIQLRSVNPSDAGDYHCQIGDGSHGDLHHTLEILVPPAVNMSPANGHVTARKGGTVTFECKASGNPSPRIEWTKKSGLLPTGEHSVSGFALTLTGIERTDAGTYQCTASNGVGQSVSSTVQLHVLFPPDVTTDRSWIKTTDGIEAQLSCVVHADPPAEVHWYQDSFPLDPTDRRTMEARGNTYTLVIRQVQSSDFGNYSCLVENSLGRTKKYVELTGRPGPIHFMGAPYSRWPTSYNVTFRVDSMAPLQEVRLLYRKVLINDTYHSPGKWHDVLLTPTFADTVTYQMSYNVRDLEPSSVFEIIIQAKNRYGWNEISDMHQFYTRGHNEVAPPSAGGGAFGYDGVEDLGLISAAAATTRPSEARLVAVVALFFALCATTTSV